LREVRAAKKKLGTATQTLDEVKAYEFKPVRFPREQTSADRAGGKNKRGLGYTGWKTGLFDQVWFDSDPERQVANIVDDEDDIAIWARLHEGDIPILWSGAERAYNPDLLAIGKDGTHWLIEAKSDKELPSEEVQGKRAAALTWANTVSSQSDVAWNYLLIAERDLADANGSWSRLRKATGA
jgi:type III restriction enzyme